jgi:FixJ family two-component response regulator
MKELEPRVFVVDDDQSIRTSLATLLEAEDYIVETFASAAKYLARVPYPGPICLVLDVQLPGLDGIALQQHLTLEGRPEQIVFITGHADIPMGIGAMKRGAVDFLPKPFSDEDWRGRWHAPSRISGSAAKSWKAVRGWQSLRRESLRCSGL